MTLLPPVVALEGFTTFGDLLKYLRRRAGLTQLELAIAVGYSDTQISRLELNQRPPDMATIAALFIPALGLEREPDTAARLLALASAMQRADAPVSGTPPFKGLHCFDEADANLFFGREALVASLLERILNSPAAHPAPRFLGIVGASGSGKSSIVRAGLIPAVRRNQVTAHWPIVLLTPTARPLRSLAARLTQQSDTMPPSPRRTTQAAVTFTGDLEHDPRALHSFIHRLLERPESVSSRSETTSPQSDAKLPPDVQHPHFLLVIDQFEELFTLCRDENERRAFVANLMTAASESNGATFVVVALRADFYAQCAPYADLRDALAAQQKYIGPMSRDELRRVIEEPARRGGWELEPGLVEVLLKDIGAESTQAPEPGALPLLSHALRETWERRQGRTLTVSGYLASGGVSGSIAETAEAVFEDQLDSHQRIIARNIFLRLTELGDADVVAATRRRANIEELILRPEEAPAVREVLTALADARLITTDDGVVEVAHEALIREWPTLRGWLEDNREGLRLHRHLTLAAEGWLRQHRDPGELYRGARLAQAAEWASVNPSEMNQIEQEFLAASQALTEEEAIEKEVQRKRELEVAQQLAETQSKTAKQLRQRALFLTGAFIVALVMAGAALFFGEQARRTAIIAQNDRLIATARELSAAALNNLSIDPERSILLAQQAISTTREVDGTVLPEAEEALHRSLVASPIRMTLTGHGTRVLSAAFRPDGKHLATIGDDGTTIVWDAATGAELHRLPGTTEPGDLITAQRIAYSPDGKLLAADDGNRVEIYDTAAYDLLLTPTGNQAEMTALAFSRDGRRIAAADSAGTVFIWDVATGEPLLEFVGHSDAVEAMTFSPDGKWLVTAGADAAMKFWDTATGDLLRNYSDFKGEVTGVAFSPDGSQFAFTGDELNVWQLDFNTVEGITTLASQELFTIPDGAGVRFSPDGKQLAAASGATESKVWDSATGQELLDLNGHTGWVMGLAFSPDSQRLATTSLDGTVRIWSLTPGQETVTVSVPVAGYGNRVVYSPNGQEFATNGGDGTATLWNAATGEPRLTLNGHDQEVLSLAFSSDGERFATGGLDAKAIVWDIVTGQKLLTLSGHEIGVRDIAFSPDGSRIATGGFDETARVWDAVTGEELLKITDHNGLVLGVAFSPDGTHLATSSTDTTAKVWDVKTGALVSTLTGHPEAVIDIAYSPDGSKIATGSSDATAKIWDAATGSELLTLTGHGSGIRPVAFSPDGRWLATGSGDNTAKVWNTVTGEDMLTLPGSEGGVYGVAFSPVDGGAHLVVASNDGIVRTFTLPMDELMALAQSRVTRSLTPEECQEYLHVAQCPQR